MKTHLIWFGIVALAIGLTYMLRDLSANKELEKVNRNCASQLSAQQNNFNLLLENWKPDTVKLPPVTIKGIAKLSHADSAGIAEAFSKVFDDSSAIKELLLPKQTEQTFIAQNDSVTVVGLSEMWFTPLTNEFENRISLDQVIYPHVSVEIHDTTTVEKKTINWGVVIGAIGAGIGIGVALTK